ncbi:hypothetical protein MNBD_ALPHA09-426 [hydrothermal vent metagenome]|uniref:DUF6460 domain-containing protein n=1 Tax=hydrothermal vent metagenome TaxID=652676 RepID=A0A3B0T9L0_9ZZZZ
MVKVNDMTALERFFGGAPGAVLTRLIVMSVIVGVIFSTIGIHPYELIESIQRLALRLYNMGFDAFAWLFGYLWLGALVVVPVWFVSRIWNVYFSQNSDDGFDDLADRPGDKSNAH